ncbi:MAG: PD40 domain-containing protein, partial [Bacteroidia bacterium]|nr:PD40 domain-containing protein [Bacteroidia bacterium]
DIYKATLQADSTWGMVVNLGDSINTAEDEDGPFIHSDGVTLFYSSKGKTSMGGYDIFRAVMRLDDSTFKRVENLGYPINSPADDIYFVLSANGTTGYYSSAKKDGYGLKDIYKVETNFTDFKPVLCLVKGTVKSDGTPVEAAIKVEMSSKSNRLFKSLRSNSSTGDYLVTVPAGVNYAITYAYNGKEETFNVDAVDMNSYTEKIHDVNFVGAPIAANTNTTAPPVAPSATTEPALATNEPAKEPAKEPVKEEPIASNTNATKNAEPEKPVSEPLASNTKPAKTAEPEKPVAKTESENSKPTEPIASNTKPAKTTEPEKPVAKAEPEKTNLPETKAPAASEPALVETKTALGSTAISEPKIMRSRNNSAGSAVDFTARPVTSTALPPELANETFNIPSKESFKPVNGPQIKSMRFAEKHNNESAPDLEFLVQVAAIKNDKNVILPNQDILGKIEKLDLNDGYIRIIVGGSFKTVGAALAHNKKVVKAGQKEGFIILIYKGQRITYEELEKLGVLKK